MYAHLHSTIILGLTLTKLLLLCAHTKGEHKNETGITDRQQRDIGGFEFNFLQKYCSDPYVNIGGNGRDVTWSNERHKSVRK